MEQNTLEYYLEKLDGKIREMFSSDNSGHDFYHLERVRDIALHIQEKEGGDRMVIGISALVHDVHRLMENEKGFYVLPKDSLPTVQKLLEEVDFPQEKMAQVLHCVEYHDEYNFAEQNNMAEDIETTILQDADNLDAIGAIGVARAFTYGGSKEMPMWTPEIPISEDAYDSTKKDPSTLHHFYTKLLKLGDNMKTETGKQLAEKRLEFMQSFVDQFISEWKGER